MFSDRWAPVWWTLLLVLVFAGGAWLGHRSAVVAATQATRDSVTAWTAKQQADSQRMADAVAALRDTVAQWAARDQQTTARWQQSQRQTAMAQQRYATALQAAATTQDSLTVALTQVAVLDSTVKDRDLSLVAANQEMLRRTAALRHAVDSLTGVNTSLTNDLATAKALITTLQATTTCRIDLLVASVGCPSRGAMFAAGSLLTLVAVTTVAVAF